MTIQPARPTVTVAIPAYNEAGRILDAVRSVLGQTEPPDELVIVDDGSTDDLAAVLRPYLGGLALIRQDNGGLSAARNRAGATATSEWVLFLDADDWLDANYLAVLRDQVEAEPWLDIFGAEAEGYSDLDGAVLYRHYRDRVTFPHFAGQRHVILQRNFLLTGIAVRRSAWTAAGGFAERFRRCEDWECYGRMILAGSRAGLLPGTLLHRRHHDSNLSGDRISMLAWRVEVLRSFLNSGSLSRAERRLVRASLRDNRQSMAHLVAGDALEELAAEAHPDGKTRLAALRVVFQARLRPRRRVLLILAALHPRPRSLAKLGGGPHQGE